MSENKNISREEIRALAEGVRNGEGAAFEKLLKIYEPMISAAVNKFSDEHHESEDLRQEALTGFFRAVMSFDFEKVGIEFGLYAKICVSNALSTAVRNSRRSGRGQPSLDYEEYFRYSAADATSDPAFRLIERENEEALRELIARNLSDFEKQVWENYLAGKNSKQISEEIGKSERSIDNALYRIRKKLRGLILSELK